MTAISSNKSNSPTTTPTVPKVVATDYFLRCRVYIFVHYLRARWIHVTPTCLLLARQAPQTAVRWEKCIHEDTESPIPTESAQDSLSTLRIVPGRSIPLPVRRRCCTRHHSPTLPPSPPCCHEHFDFIPCLWEQHKPIRLSVSSPPLLSSVSREESTTNRRVQIYRRKIHHPHHPI